VVLHYRCVDRKNRIQFDYDSRGQLNIGDRLFGETGEFDVIEIGAIGAVLGSSQTGPTIVIVRKLT
jgi:hypothetical protein